MFFAARTRKFRKWEFMQVGIYALVQQRTLPQRLVCRRGVKEEKAAKSGAEKRYAFEAERLESECFQEAL